MLCRKEIGLCRVHRAHGKLTKHLHVKTRRQLASSMYRKNYIAGNAISRHTIQISTIYHYSPLFLACSLLLDVWLLYLQLAEQKSNKDILHAW
jgi:Zn-dependent membrane protease YugP